MLGILGQPLPSVAKPSYTVTSVKIRSEIWERLRLVASLTGRNQQDLIAEALLDLFEKVRNHDDSAGQRG